jgi:DNA-directed RNA polymerase subunit RPC12/RpoP
MNDSINSFDLPELDETLDIDLEAEAFPDFKPVSDGEYLLRLEPEEEGSSVKTVDGVSYVSIPFAVSIVDPGNGLDGRKVRFQKVSTRLNKSRTSRAIGLLKAVGATPSGPLSAKNVANAVESVINSHAEFLGTLRMEGYCKDCGKTVLRGDRKFTDGEAECPKCGSEVRGRMSIVKMRRAE